MTDEQQNFDQVRNLASAINLPDPNLFIGAVLIKGVVTAYTYPYASVQLGGDTTTTITNVRHLESYMPVVGDAAHILKQGSDILLLGRLNTTTASPALNGWVTPTLGTGITAPFDTVRYREVNDSGERKVQFRGKVAVSGTNTTLFTLPAPVRPILSVDLLAARDITGGSCSVQISVNATTGVVSLVGVTTGLKDSQYLSGSPRTGLQSSAPNTSAASASTTGTTDVNHTHFSSDGPNPATPSSWTTTINTGFTAHTHTIAHIHTGGDHQHYMDAVDHPTSVSLNGLEFFL